MNLIISIKSIIHQSNLRNMNIHQNISNIFILPLPVIEGNSEGNHQPQYLKNLLPWFSKCDVGCLSDACLDACQRCRTVQKHKHFCLTKLNLNVHLKCIVFQFIFCWLFSFFLEFLFLGSRLNCPGPHLTMTHLSCPSALCCNWLSCCHTALCTVMQLSQCHIAVTLNILTLAGSEIGQCQKRIGSPKWASLNEITTVP